MQFKLRTSGNYYYDIQYRKKLEALGFNFKPSEFKYFLVEGRPMVEIETLEDLLSFADEWGEIIVARGEIEIYDGCRE